MSEFRYRKLGYIALNVTDLAQSTPFYRDVVGLDLSEQGDRAAYFRIGPEHHTIVLEQAPQAGLKRIGWELENEGELEPAFDWFRQLGMNPGWLGDNERQALHQGPAFRVREPNTGACFEYYAHMQMTTAAYAAEIVDITSLGHVLLRTDSFTQTLDQLVGKMNFMVSDMVGEWIAFLRCFPNPMHHSFGIVAAPKIGLHHLTFMVRDFDEIGKSFNRLRNAGVEIAYGPGRHPPSGSFFLYFHDPDGLTVEYSHGMEEFPEVRPRKYRVLDPVPRSLDYWGGIPEASFAATGTIETG